jgi:methyl-accepting chemotaxis protein
MTTAAANITRQIHLISQANGEHSAQVERVAGRLKSIRTVVDRNTSDARETSGSSGALVSHAEALRSLLPRAASRNGRQPQPRRSTNRA